MTTTIEVSKLQSASRNGRLVYDRQPGLHAAFISPAFRRFVDTNQLRDAQQDAIHRYVNSKGPA